MKDGLQVIIYQMAGSRKMWNIRRQSLLMSEEAGIDWEDGGETLPSGWMKRPEFGQMI